MSPVRLIILGVAAAAAIVAVFLVRSTTAPAPAAAAAISEPVKKEVKAEKHILVAKRPLPVGQYLTVEDLKWQEWPDSAATPSFIDEKITPDGLEKSVGAVVRTALVEGEPITADKIAHAGGAGFMAAILNPGMRAVTIEISAETAAGGFILPNDHVDIIITREIEGAKGSNAIANVRSEMILANVRVLAIDAIYGPPPTEGQGAPIIGTRATLELSDKDATMINAARKAGELILTLRSITELQGKEGATAAGRAYRDGVASSIEGVKVYRYGTEAVATVPAG